VRPPASTQLLLLPRREPDISHSSPGGGMTLCLVTVAVATGGVWRITGADEGYTPVNCRAPDSPNFAVSAARTSSAW